MRGDGVNLSGGPLDDPRVLRALGLLNPDGEETRLVGGIVRNTLLGRPSSDIDLATTLEPRAVQRLAARAGLRSIPTGIAHGTITLQASGLALEVTTLREDVETDGRHAVVRFGRDFEADALRRDFTINAMSARPDGRIFDYAGGLDDLAHRRVRFIGDPGRRIREDYLRILRFFRFHATYGEGSPDPAGLAAVAAHRNGLQRLSRERIRAELFKILVAPSAVAAVGAMAGAGVLEAVFGHEASPARFERLASLSAPPDPLLGLAALALRRTDAVDDARAALRLSNAETSRLDAAQKARQALATAAEPPDAAGLRKLVFYYGAVAAADGLRLAYADDPRRAAATWDAAVEQVTRIGVPALPISGNDLLARGLSGPVVGLALDRFRSLWAAADFPPESAAIDRLLDQAVSIGRDQPAS